MGRRRLVARLDQLQGEANATMAKTQETLVKAQATLSHADKAILEMTVEALKSLSLLYEVLKNVLDGKTNLNLEIAGNKMPIGIGLDFDKDDEDAAELYK